MQITNNSMRVSIQTTIARQTAKTDFATLMKKYEKQMQELQAAHCALSQKYEQMGKRCIRDLEHVQAAYKRDMLTLGDAAAKNGLRDLSQEAKECARCMTDDARLMLALQKVQQSRSRAYQSLAALSRAMHDIMTTTIRNIRA